MAGLNGYALPRSYLNHLNTLGGLGNALVQVGVRFQDLDVFYGSEQLLWVLPLLPVVWLMPNTHQILSEHVSETQRGNNLITLRFAPSFGWGAYVGCLLLLSLASMTKISEFIYFTF